MTELLYKAAKDLLGRAEAVRISETPEWVALAVAVERYELQNAAEAMPKTPSPAELYMSQLADHYKNQWPYAPEGRFESLAKNLDIKMLMEKGIKPLDVLYHMGLIA